MTTNLSRIMKDAWNRARAGARKFGGSVRSYFAAALRQAWELAKDPQEIAAQRILTNLKADGRFAGKVWAKGDHVRIYVEDYGYIAVNANGSTRALLRRYHGNITTAAGL